MSLSKIIPLSATSSIMGVLYIRIMALILQFIFKLEPWNLFQLETLYGLVTGFFDPDIFEYANNGPKYEDILSTDDFNCQVRYTSKTTEEVV